MPLKGTTFSACGQKFASYITDNGTRVSRPTDVRKAAMKLTTSGSRRIAYDQVLRRTLAA